MDEYVKPKNNIINYNTLYFLIIIDIVESPKKYYKMLLLHCKIFKLNFRIYYLKVFYLLLDSILIGHSLENDLKAI